MEYTPFGLELGNMDVRNFCDDSRKHLKLVCLFFKIYIRLQLLKKRHFTLKTDKSKDVKRRSEASRWRGVGGLFLIEDD